MLSMRPPVTETSQVPFEQFQRRSDAIYAEIDGQAIVLGPQATDYLALNRVASRIWKIIEQPTSVTQIVEELRREYDVPEDECRTAVVEFLRQLLQRDLLSPVSSR